MYVRPYEAVTLELVQSLLYFMDSPLETTELMRVVPTIFNPQRWIDRLIDEDFTEVYAMAYRNIGAT